MKDEDRMSDSVKTEKDKRVNDILLGPVERKVLKYFVTQMPAWVTSDMLTFLGLFASALILFSYLMAGQGELQGNWFLHLASLGYFLNWFGDSLDGTLARERHEERPNYGYFIDHSIDGLTALAIFGGLGFSHISDLTVALLAASAYLLLIISVSLKTHATGVFEMTSIKFGPTEIRVLAVIFNTYIFFAGNPIIPGVPLVGNLAFGTLVLGIIGVAMFLYYFYETLRTGSQLAKEDEYTLIRRQIKAAKKAAKAERKLAKKAAKEQRRMEKDASREGKINADTMI